MRYRLQVQVVKAHHNLHNDIAGLIFGEILDHLQPLKQFAALDDLGDDVVILPIF